MQRDGRREQHRKNSTANGSAISIPIEEFLDFGPASKNVEITPDLSPLDAGTHAFWDKIVKLGVAWFLQW